MNNNVIYESLVSHARRAILRARCTDSISDLKEAQGAIAKARKLKHEQIGSRNHNDALASYANCIMNEYEAEKRLSRSGNTQKHLRNAAELLENYRRVMLTAKSHSRGMEYGPSVSMR